RLYLDRAKANESLNAYITLAEERALAQAATADERRARGDATLITGVPIAHKDIFCTRDLLTSCGSRMLENFAAPYDATVVTRLDAAGVVTLGKANMDEFAMGSSNENSAFGSVANPWDTERVPGGSSGGSAAIVAAGLAAAATGTDTGGSIRQPAAFCGITGLKPTYGLVSRYGMVAFASSLDQGGWLARSAADIALLLPHMAGFDPLDSTSSTRTDPWLDGCRTAPLEPGQGLNIGLPTEYFEGLGVPAAAIDAARQVLEASGFAFRDVSLPHTSAAIPAYYIIAGAEASTNLSRYDGVRFGHRCENPTSLDDLYRRSRSEGFGAEVKRRILTGTYALSVGYFDAYYLKAQKIRRLIQQDFLAAFDQVDLLLVPTTPDVAFKRGELTDDPVAMYQQDIFTIPASLAGLPAMALPCGFHDGLPLGMQLIAPHFGERQLLETAEAFQRQTDFHQQRPEVA
ncbi:MAG: Asp-tRNA(Asn)/Glu-tRNA(Gln) amidotransferase subunit GatA, partial [Gammaproteobacteria bacterium]